MDLTGIEAIARAAAAADGAEPLDEGAWRRLRHHADELEVAVDPGRGFSVVDGDLLHLVVAPRVREHGVGRALGEGAVGGSDHAWQAWSHGDHPGAAALARVLGFERTRALWVMRRSLADFDTSAGTSTAYTLRSFHPGDEAEVVRVNAAAFASHPEQGRMDLAELRERMSEPWFDPAGLLVAEADGRLLGFHWTKRHSATLGEVYVVGIDPTAQGSGVGRALVTAGLAHLRDGGTDEVLLYVESDNAPAVHLYEKLGFMHASADTHVMYTRGVSGPAS